MRNIFLNKKKITYPSISHTFIKSMKKNQNTGSQFMVAPDQMEFFFVEEEVQQQKL